ncbi:MAG TPA: BON domain-containing protein [Vicinamibacteria bacterium]
MRSTLSVALLAAVFATAPAAAPLCRASDVKKEVKKDAKAVKKDAKETWLETKVKYHLVTADDVPGGAIHVDVGSGGVVTLHGKVETAAEKAKAEEVTSRIDGVKSVKNMLEVVPKSRRAVVKASDKEVKDRVEATLKADKRFEDIHLKSVDNGVVLLSGKATLSGALRAVEAVDAVPGVRHVSSEIEVSDKP